MRTLSKALVASVVFHLVLPLSVIAAGGKIDTSEAAEEKRDASEAPDWKIDTPDKNLIRLYVHGNATWGDELMFFFNKFDCSKAEVILHFSSYEKEVMDFQGGKILMKFGKNELDSKISTVIDFLPPHRIAVIRLGFVERKLLSNLEMLGNELEVRISKNNPQKVQDAFDMKFNTYSMPGFTEALKSVERNCMGGVTEAAA